MPQSEFPITFEDGIVSVKLPARIDVSNTKRFVETLQAELDSGHLRIVLDFAATEAIDSTALGAMVQVFKTLRSRDGVLSLCNVGAGVKRVFAITRVDRVFSIYESHSEARARCTAIG